LSGLRSPYTFDLATDFIAYNQSATGPNTQALFATDALNGEIILAFRGTQLWPFAAGTLYDSFADVCTDLSNLKAVPYSPQYPDALVGTGFASAWNVVKDAVLKRLQQLGTTVPHAKIRITGHSLGAAIA